VDRYNPVKLNSFIVFAGSLDKCSKPVSVILLQRPISKCVKFLRFNNCSILSLFNILTRPNILSFSNFLQESDIIVIISEVKDTQYDISKLINLNNIKYLFFTDLNV
jgi:hypothetical protein